jgi:hypothetical protein
VFIAVNRVKPHPIINEGYSEPFEEELGLNTTPA